MGEQDPSAADMEAEPEPLVVLGEGSDATLYLQRDSGLVLKHHKLTASFLRELRVLKAFSAPFFVRMHSYVVDECVLYLEKFDCDLLTYLMDRAPLLCPPRNRYFQHHTMLCILKGLAQMHERGLVHNDVKPENVLVSKAPLRVVLADFGRTSFPGEEAQRPGTRCYAAPEVLAGRGGRSGDCWSAGIVGYACLELQLPFGAEELEGGEEAAEAVTLALQEKQRTWPSWASWLISRLLQVDPKARLSALQGMQHLEKVEDPLTC